MPAIYDLNANRVMEIRANLRRSGYFFINYAQVQA